MGRVRVGAGTGACAPARTVLAALTAAVLLVVPAAVVASPASSEVANGPDALSAASAGPLPARVADHDHDRASLNHHEVSPRALGARDPVSNDAAPSASEVPSGFQDLVAIGGLSEPTAVAFAPDGTAFIALKTGVIKTLDYDAGSDQYEPFANHVNFANLDLVVNNYWDRGLTGITVDPQFGTAGHNFVYVNYAYNRDPRDNPAVVPKWGTSGQYDDCANPASMGPPVVTGCLINIRVSRLTAVKQTAGWVMTGSELPLLEGACQQFSSHASGDVRIGPDGWLYASAGDGASFDTEDWGQANNPCPGDPANGIEGGSLRSQDLRTSTDPLGFGGAIVRMNPATGAAPNGSSSNADRMVVYGQRNPWRFTFRPGTNELWSGDVGGSNWEEINRTAVSPGMTPVNLGWPCYEGNLNGSERQPGWDALNIAICENLYGAGVGAVQAPYFSYRTRGPNNPPLPGADCETGTSSVSGVAFVPSSSNYPAAYRGSLFFSDYARACIWRLGKKGNDDPEPTSIINFVDGAETPVDLVTGPNGDLFYVDYGIEGGVPTAGAGAVHRIVYTPDNQAPVAAVSANPTFGPAPLAVNFSAAGSTDADAGDVLSYAWDLDGDTQFDDATGVTASRTYSTPGNVTVTVEVSDGNGGVDTDSVTISPGDTAPTLTTVSPTTSLTWQVGQTVNFSATATDAQQTLTEANYAWDLSIRHCPSVCHTHPVTEWTGKRTGSFTAPDHEHPSHLLLTVTVTDSQGLQDSETVQLDPKSVALTFASSPTGALLTVAGADRTTPHTQTFIVGSHFQITAPESRVINGATYTFGSWSDGGARSHAVTAPATSRTYQATYPAPRRKLVVTTRPGGLVFTVNGTRHRSGWDRMFAVGTLLRVVAPPTQWHDGHRYRFVRWSDGGNRRHQVTMPSSQLRLRAIYRRIR